MKQRIELNVETRETGRAANRALRVDKKVPAVVYGSGKNTNVWVLEKDIVKYNTRNYENALFNLKSAVKDADGRVVLMKDVNVHPLTRRPQHVDFYALDLTKPVRVFVEIRLEGKPIGIAEGGLLNVVNRQIEVECLATDIPDFISHDISQLGVGDAVHVSDLKVPAKVKVISSVELTLAVVNVQEEEVIAAPTVDAAAAAAPGATPAAAGAAAPAAGAAAPAAGAKPAAAPAKDAGKK